MRQFIPFEDDWDALERLRPEDLIPYRVGLLDRSATIAQRAVPASPSIFSSSFAPAPMRCTVPAESSST
jgi:hypothetical protein